MLKIHQLHYSAVFILLCTINAVAEQPAFRHNGVTAHRGDSGTFPENTMPAFESAMKLGVDWIELDIFRTRDGQLVVIHDETTQAVGDRSVHVHDENYAVLTTIDVAHRFRERNEMTLNKCPKEAMPLLSDVLERIRSQRKTRVSIQPKDGSTELAVKMVKDMHMEAWVGFNDGDLAKMSKVKELAPTIHVFWDRPANFDVDKDIAIAQAKGFESMVIHVDGITQEVVDKIHAANIEVGAWTVNDVAAMQRLLDLGVDRIYTDEPGRLLELKKERQENG